MRSSASYEDRNAIQKISEQEKFSSICRTLTPVHECVVFTKLPSKVNDSFFHLKEKKIPNLTRSHLKREILFGVFSKHQLSHSAVFFCYPYRELGYGAYSLRIYFVELFNDAEGNTNILSVTGPHASTRDYKAEKFYLTFTSMEELEEIAKMTMANHGSYNYLLNNCKHFSYSLLEMVKKECKQIPLEKEIDWVVLNDFLDSPYNLDTLLAREDKEKGDITVSWKQFLDDVANYEKNVTK